MSDLSGSGELDEELEEQIGDSGGGDEFEDRLDIKPPQLTSSTGTADRLKHRHEERDRRRRRKHEYRETRRSRRDRHEEREVRASGSGRHRRHRRDRSRESSRQHHKSNRGASREMPQPPPADDNGGGDPRYQSRARQRADGPERHSRNELTASSYPVPGDLRQRIQQQQQQQQQQQYMVGEDEAYREHRHRRPASGHGSLMLSVVADQQDRSRHDDSAAGWRREVREEVVPLEVQRRRERCLQAVRQSEYQRDVSRRELEARRIRRDQEREIRRRREHHEREELEHSEERSPSSERKRRRLEAQSQQTDMFAAESECEEEALEDEEERISADQAEENGCDDEADRQSIGQEAGESDKSSEESSSDQNDEEQTEESSSSSSSSSAEGDDERDRVENGSERKRSSSRARESAEDEDSRLAEGRRRWRTDSRSPSPEANNLRSRSPTPVEHEPEYDDAKLRSLTPPSSPEPEQRLPPYLPAVLGCRNVVEFNCLNRIEEGTYGVVYRAEDKRTKEIVALKRLKMENEKEGFPITSLREINTLLKAQHENIVTVREIVVGSNMDKIYIVMDYVEHDLKSLMQTMKEKKQTFVSGEVKCLMVQLMRAVRHLHDNWILHRDLKTSNLLLSHRGILKVGDFGLAREYGSPLQNYTAVVVTLWYRAPELLLGSRLYTCPIDVWSAGCIFAELLRMEPLFPGKSEVDEINKIFKELGTPNETIWPGYSKLPAVSKMTFADYPYNQLANKFGTVLTETGLRLLNQLLTYDPDRRITADDALSHPYFAEHPRPIDPSMFPTWPAKSEMSHRKSGNSPKPPSGRKNIGDEDVRFQLAPGAAAGGGFSLKF